jgi:hypothetical protein
MFIFFESTGTTLYKVNEQHPVTLIIIPSVIKYCIIVITNHWRILPCNDFKNKSIFRSEGCSGQTFHIDQVRLCHLVPAKPHSYWSGQFLT